MGSLRLTAYLLIVVVQGAMGATKGLGEACTTGTDTCTSTPESVCDNVVNKCLIKQGQSCSGGFSGMCVSGAECTTSTCTCKASIYTADAGTGLCTSSGGKWGLACPNGDECTGTATGCVGGFCVCNADKAVDLTTGDCTGTIANEKVGKACVTADKATTCGAASTNLECPAAGGVCDCKTGYFGPLAGGCSPAPGKTGGGCSADADCTATDNTCSSNVCKINLGGACTTTSDCLDANAECDAFAKTCLLKTDQVCNTPATKQDKCVSGASCDTTGDSASNQCKCIADVYTVSSNLCYATTAGKVTGTCKAAAPKCDDTNAECDTTSTRCMCKTGFKLKNTDATCEKSGAITVIASALTLMLVCVSGHLITLH